MTPIKAIVTRLGDHEIITMDVKAKPMVIPPRQQEVSEDEQAKQFEQLLRDWAKMDRLHRKVKLWASEHLEGKDRERFFTALTDCRYDVAYDVLRNTWLGIGTATFYQRDIQWPKWHANFERGYFPRG